MPKGWKTIIFREDLAKILKIEARRLGYESIGKYVETLNAVRTKMGWSKLDLDCLVAYGKIPVVETVSGSSEKEVMAKLGLKDAKKLGEPFTENFTPVQVEVKPKESDDPAEILAKDPHAFDKKKPTKPKKRTETTKLSMPTTEQFFEKPKKFDF